MIGESDQLNAERNAASREIGALMKEGKRDEAEGRRKQVGELKDRIGELDQLRDKAETRLRDMLSSLPNLPARQCARWCGRRQQMSKSAAGA